MEPLDPQIIARYWLAKWDDTGTESEKELNSWVDNAYFSARDHDADYFFKIVEAIHEQDILQEHIEVVAAGPVEDLLAHHGEKVIERVVALATSDPKFAQVLGGVWKSDMEDSVWELVRKHRDTSIWADARD